MDTRDYVSRIIIGRFCVCPLSGLGGIRTLVRTDYLRHAKILVVNSVMIGHRIRFKPHYSLSKPFSPPIVGS